MARALLLVLAMCLAALARATNFYEVLGVSSDADEAAIKKAYRKLSLKYHPGACPGREGCTTRRPGAALQRHVSRGP